MVTYQIVGLIKAGAHLKEGSMGSGLLGTIPL